MFPAALRHVLVFLSISVLFSYTEHHTLRTDITSHPNWKLLDRGDDCGHSVADRIIGGDDATLGQYPWIARLGYSDDELTLVIGTFGDKAEDNDSQVFYDCGGAIINEKYILTAAHCGPKAMQVPLTVVRLGEHSVKTDPDCVDGVCAPPVQDIKVEECICHKRYNRNTFHEDICLLRLANPIKFTDFVSPICLPVYDMFRSMKYGGKVMEVAGWGVSDIFVRKGSDILQTLKVPILTDDRCAAIYLGKAEINAKQMCAGGVIGKDSCSGDSGGPLMAPFSINGPPRYFIIGVVSFGPRFCANTETPGVYTKVTEHMMWILDNIRA